MSKTKFEYIMEQVYFFIVGLSNLMYEFGWRVVAVAFVTLMIGMVGHVAYEPIFTFAPYDITEIRSSAEIYLFGESEPDICNKIIDNTKCFANAFATGLASFFIVGFSLLCVWMILKGLNTHGKNLYREVG